LTTSRKGPAGALRFRLELGRHVVIEGQRRSHALMLLSDIMMSRRPRRLRNTGADVAPALPAASVARASLGQASVRAGEKGSGCEPAFGASFNLCSPAAIPRQCVETYYRQ
jgi:hypothetical protein